MNFTEEQIARYSRHILLPDIGGKGQEKLLKASVLIVGAGGLGCAVGYYLAAAGVGAIGLVDDDRVELSNLQRQIAHSVNTIGLFKADSAKATFEALNPDAVVTPYKLRLTHANVLDIMKDYDIVVDVTDNFPTRFLINDACVLSHKPLVSGAILQFEGQATTIAPGKGHCYRCVFESPPPAGLIPSCQEAGVLGALCGVIGSIQATEVVKIILNKGEILMNSILVYNALTTTFRKIQIARNPDCLVCGPSATIKTLGEYGVNRIC